MYEAFQPKSSPNVEVPKKYHTRSFSCFENLFEISPEIARKIENDTVRSYQFG